MSVADRFDIAGRGVVLTGQLEGSGVLRAGDTAVSGTGEGEIIGIEALQSRLAQAETGANVGLNLGPWAPGELVAGAQLMFRAPALRRECQPWTPTAPSCPACGEPWSGTPPSRGPWPLPSVSWLSDVRDGAPQPL
jgi:hypothetical protein